MKSFTNYSSQYATLINSGDSTDLSEGLINVNDSIRLVCKMNGGKWKFLEILKTLTTVDGQQAYKIPASIRDNILTDFYITVSTQIYNPNKVEDPIFWNSILAANLGESDVARYAYIQGNSILVAPTPATTGSTITFRGRRRIKDLSIANYTTGTIVTATLGSTAIIGDTTVWTAAMAGRWLRITDSDTALKGDGEWYEIESVTDATHLTLVKPYEGTSIAAGSAAYAIGQMSYLPEPYDMAPLYRAAAIYWTIQGQIARANMFWRAYDGGVEAGLTDKIGGLIGQMIDSESQKFEASYMPPESESNWDVNNPPITITISG